MGGCKFYMQNAAIKITIEVDKSELICLLKGTAPGYKIFNVDLLWKCGRYPDGFNGRWEWNDNKLLELTEEELYKLYIICRNY